LIVAGIHGADEWAGDLLSRTHSELLASTEPVIRYPAKLDHAVLGPEAVLVIRIGGDEGYMPAIFRGDQQNVRIRPSRRMLERREGNERVILRVND